MAKSNPDHTNLAVDKEIANRLRAFAKEQGTKVKEITDEALDFALRHGVPEVQPRVFKFKTQQPSEPATNSPSRYPTP